MPVGKKGFGGLVSGETQQAVMMLGFRNLSKQRDQDSGIDNYKHLDFMPAHSLGQFEK